MNWLFMKLLKRFCEKELDQFALWKMQTKFGWVYITIIRESDHPDIFSEIK